MKSVLLLGLFAVSSCGVVKAPLNPELKAEISTIELARLETENILMIRRVNPVITVMGTSGMLLDAMILTDNASEYEKRAGPVNQMCIDLFQQTLMQALTAQGYRVGSSNRQYWDYFRIGQKKKLRHIDAILHIRLKQVGFWSGGLTAPYRPSIIVQAELKDPSNRKVLYSDRFAMGLDITSLKVMELGYGKIRELPVIRKAASYRNLDELFKKPDQSRDALLEMVAAAARHVAKGFKRPGPPTLLAFDPELVLDMPKAPLLDDLRE